MLLRNSKETNYRLVDPFISMKMPPTSLAQSYPFPAQMRAYVWVKVEGKWIHGVVVGDNVGDDLDPRPERWFKVQFGRGTVMDFAPVYGDMKPDTQIVRDLLRKEGYFV